MNEPPLGRGANDPNALTQPIPVVPVVPVTPSPDFQSARSTPVPPLTPVAPPAVVMPASAPYRHRFGNIPFYLCRRLAACFIDVFVVAFVAGAFAFQALDAGLFALAARSETTFLALAAFAFGTALAFAFVCEALFGTTLGKLTFALHVRRRSGGHAGVFRVFLRSLLRPVDLLVIGPLLALVTPRHQRLGDFVAGTVVGRSRLGFFATLLGVVLLVALGYAQAVFGGGLTSAVGVSAEVADYAPPLVGRALAALGIAHSFGIQFGKGRTQPNTGASAIPVPRDSGAGNVL